MPPDAQPLGGEGGARRNTPAGQIYLLLRTLVPLDLTSHHPASNTDSLNSAGLAGKGQGKGSGLDSFGFPGTVEKKISSANNQKTARAMFSRVPAPRPSGIHAAQ